MIEFRVSRIVVSLRKRPQLFEAENASHVVEAGSNTCVGRDFAEDSQNETDSTEMNFAVVSKIDNYYLMGSLLGSNHLVFRSRSDGSHSHWFIIIKNVALCSVKTSCNDSCNSRSLKAAITSKPKCTLESLLVYMNLKLNEFKSNGLLWWISFNARELVAIKLMLDSGSNGSFLYHNGHGLSPNPIIDFSVVSIPNAMNYDALNDHCVVLC